LNTAATIEKSVDIIGTVATGSEYLPGAPSSIARNMTDTEDRPLNEKADLKKKKKKKDAQKGKELRSDAQAPTVLTELQPYEQVKLNLESILAGLHDGKDKFLCFLIYIRYTSRCIVASQAFYFLYENLRI
jgi:hypothetical protein